MKRRGVMRRSAVAGLALVTASSILTVVNGGAAMAAPSDKPRVKVRGTEALGTVPDRYIVVLKDDKASPKKVRSAASTLAEKHGGTVRRVFTNALNGYSASMNQRQAAKLATHPDVAYVEQVRRATALGTQTNPPSWGLDRIDQSTARLNSTYRYPNTASDVTAYILDTGIDIDHQDFGGRASHGYDAIDQDDVAQDCDGHGTHVAGTVGGTTYGVAKDVKLVGVRVLDCTGSGTSEQIIAGIDWVTANAVKPAVANMSLGFGETIQAVNDAVNRSIASGVTYAVAAGNSMRDACDISPANVPAAITVGATDRIDMRAWFSNHGRCVEVFAPGVSITSAAAGTGNGGVAYNGTSMAAPHVAGAAALLLQSNKSWTPTQVRNRIVTTGIGGAVYDVQGSLDRLLTVGSVTPSRSSYGLKARSNGKYVVAESKGTKPLVNRSSVLGAWEKFDIVDAGSGLIALRSKTNGKYVVAESKGAKPLIARSTSVSTWEKFQLIHHTDGTVSLKAKANGKYVTAHKSGTSALIASKTVASTWEKFDLDAPPPVVSIRSKASGKYVVAESKGAKPLIARSTSVSTWEKFEIVSVDYGFFGMKSLANGKYVAAESRGTKPLIARSSAIGEWEIFDFADYNPDGTIFFRAWVDDQAVSAGSAGTSQLISNKDIDWFADELGLGAGEKFLVSAA